MSDSGFRLERVREPELVFANDGRAKDPRAGLLKYGPCPRATGVEHEVVNVGIVGDSRSISMMESLLRDMRTGVPSKKNRQRWKPDFPGLGSNSELRFDYQTLEKWKGRIQSSDIGDIGEIRDRSHRTETAFNHIKYQIQRVCKQTPPPDIVFVVIPERVVEYCSDPDTDTNEIRTKDGNFRSRIKIVGMQEKPTQLMTPKALRGGNDVQERSEMAWNIAVGMLYKAREGRPWKLADLRSRTCYAGISFYQERSDDPETRAAIAQVFIDDGRNFVIEGGAVEDIATEERQTHISYTDAKRLVENILEEYGNQRDEMPRRLVLHKSSNFLEDETRGFSDGASDVKTKEFITVRKRHPLRLFGQGDNPPLRGTLAIPPEEREYYLYTTGFVPEQSVYNNPGTPKPLVLRPHPEYFSGDYHRICEEILKFTKLDWNSSDFCKRLPVTIGIADAVSEILAEPAASEVNLQTHYYYYM
ncbi:hypothetical protein [Haloarcula sp. JP-L23]|uniref:argonaute/piwi family protein n=1 Tax=Haloarcula sp. JP-L23 TaxID=2716717 RepID=UPI00140EE6BC|nr:hypothetical protein G9465_23725 [Haloarcula sp. JP-L23]